jgi:hypothetical protein
LLALLHRIFFFINIALTVIKKHLTRRQTLFARAKLHLSFLKRGETLSLEHCRPVLSVSNYFPGLLLCLEQLLLYVELNGAALGKTHEHTQHVAKGNACGARKSKQYKYYFE